MSKGGGRARIRAPQSRAAARARPHLRAPLRHATRRGIEWSIDGGVAWVWLSRPRQGNRIDLPAAQALCDAAETLELDDRVVLVVLAARGASFSLGVEDGGTWETTHDWIAAIARLTHPVIAMVQGDAIAEGCELALACDLRISSAAARFALPQVTDGRLPSHGATQRLPRLIGRTRAMDLLLSGRAVGAREAEAIGLVNRVIAGGELELAVRREATALVDKGPVALRLAKEAVAKSLDLTLEQGMRLEQDLYVLLQTTADRAEGVRAFLQKRRPRFRGA